MTFNIGTGIETSNQTVFETIAAEYRYTGAPLYKPARAGEVERTAVNAALAKKHLGWHPATDFKTGIKHIHDSKN